MSLIVRRPSRPLVLFVALLGLHGAAPRLRAQSAPSASAGDTSGNDLINADRPGIADGSRVVGAGELQLEMAYQQERHTDGDARSRLSFAPTLVRIGLASRLEGRVESNTITHERVVAADGTVSTSTGLSLVFLGAKLGLYDSGVDEDRRSVGMIARVAPPSGSDAFRTTHTTGDVRLAADWDFAPQLSLNPNVGWARDEGSDGTTFGTALGALTLTWQPTPRWSPFVDAGYQSREDAGGTWSMIVDAGVGYVVGRDVQLDVSAGQGIHGSSTPKPFVAVGVSVRTGVLRRTGYSLDHGHGDRSAQSAR